MEYLGHEEQESQIANAFLFTLRIPTNLTFLAVKEFLDHSALSYIHSLPPRYGGNGYRTLGLSLVPTLQTSTILTPHNTYYGWNTKG